MRKRIILLGLIGASMLLTGCGNKNITPQWDGEKVLGEIDEDAEVVDTNDYQEEMEIDNYVKIEEMNKPDGENTWDNYRTHYNRLAQQLGMDILDSRPDEVEPSLQDAVNYAIYQGNSNNIITINEDSKEIYNIYVEQVISIKEDGDSFGEAVAKLMPAIYGGVPQMKKFDLNQVYLGMRDALGDEKGTFSYEYNGYLIQVDRNINLAKITIYKTALGTIET